MTRISPIKKWKRAHPHVVERHDYRREHDTKRKPDELRWVWFHWADSPRKVIRYWSKVNGEMAFKEPSKDHK